jgi:hypothetical protein
MVSITFALDRSQYTQWAGGDSMNELTTTNTHDPKSQINKLVEADAKTMDEAAAVMGISVSEAEDFLVEHAPAIEAEATRSKLSGRLTVPMAHRIVIKLLEKIESAANGDIDAFEASDLLKQPLRILENHDRNRLADRDKKDSLPVFHFHINRGGGFSLTPVERTPAPEVVDVTPRELGGDL